MTKTSSFMTAWAEAEGVLTSPGNWHVVPATPENCIEVSFTPETGKKHVLFVFGKESDGDITPARHKPHDWIFSKWTPIIACEKGDLYSADGALKLAAFGIGARSIDEARKLLVNDDIVVNLPQRSEIDQPSMQMAAQTFLHPQHQ